MLDQVVNLLASQLARALLLGATKQLKSAALGPKDEAALRRVCASVANKIARDLSSASNSKEERDHAADLFGRLLEYMGDSGLPWLRTQVDQDIQIKWQTALSQLGMDQETFPIDFRRALSELFGMLPMELALEARKADSPLFNRLALESLDDVSRRIASIRELGDDIARQLIPYSAPFKSSLDRELTLCRTKDISFQTPAMLRAILLCEDQRARACLVEIDREAATRIIGRLESYAKSLSSTAHPPFSFFEWRDRDDLRRAAEVAVNNHQNSIGALTALVGVLDTASVTRSSLARLLQQDIFRLRHLALHRLGQTPNEPTPLISF